MKMNQAFKFIVNNNTETENKKIYEKERYP